MAYQDDPVYPAQSYAAVEGRTRGHRLLLWMILVFLVAMTAWASVSRIDEVTRGQGRVIPSSHVQTVQNLEGGIVSEIFVREGDVVDKEQPLLRLDATSFGAQYRENRRRLVILKAKATRLRAEAEGEPFEIADPALQDAPEVLARERELYRSRQDEQEKRERALTNQIDQKRQRLMELEASLERLNTSHRLARQELAMTEPLLGEGVISEVELLRLKREVNEIRGEAAATRHQIARVREELDEARTRLEEARLSFANQARAELNEVQGQIEALSEVGVSLADRVQRTVVRAPVKGTVKRIMVNTIGGVVEPGMDLVEIVPLEDKLQVEARIAPADIAFLHPGQKAVVKLTAYDYATYGTLKGEVTHISADTIVDENENDAYYLVKVETEQTELRHGGKALPIIPGMRTEVDILTGEKTILDYILTPVLRAKDTALRER